MAGMCQSEVVLLPKLLLGGLCVCFTRSHVELGSCLNVSEQLLTYTWLTQRRERTNDCALTGATRWVQQELNRQHLYKKVTFEWTSDSDAVDQSCSGTRLTVTVTWVESEQINWAISSLFDRLSRLLSLYRTDSAGVSYFTSEEMKYLGLAWDLNSQLQLYSFHYP